MGMLGLHSDALQGLHTSFDDVIWTIAALERIAMQQTMYLFHRAYSLYSTWKSHGLPETRIVTNERINEEDVYKTVEIYLNLIRFPQEINSSYEAVLRRKDT